MDLRSIINSEAGDTSISKPAAPVTPVQAHPQQSFRDYSQSVQTSPGKLPSQDYGTSQGGLYTSPTTFQGKFPGRPPPPPIQAPPQNDLRSPVSARSYSAQSPYLHTPASIPNQYPFPPTHQTPRSPVQHHQYPPPHQRRDSHSSQQPPLHLQHQNSFTQPSPTPQTPPVGIPGAPHPYLQHQRSQSSISTSTPTSAHSQQPFFNQYSQDSPVSVSHLPSGQQASQTQRQQSQPPQQSQPGTPLGPPLPQRQPSGVFSQPQSPYQQRLSSGSYSQARQASPVAPPPVTPNAYDSHRGTIVEQQRRSQSERERSLSVSPKTRLPSLSRIEPNLPQPDPEHTQPGKRKMDDRQTPVEETRRVKEEQYDVKAHVNGGDRLFSSSPQQPPKKRARYYKEPPIWAQSIRNKGGVRSTNINGKKKLGVSSKPHPGLKSAIKLEANGLRQASPANARQLPSADVITSNASILLGAWEPSITGQKPNEEMTKLVADFLFFNVVSRNDMGELASRGVEIEIEAKLGQLIDRDTNQRYFLPVKSECVLAEASRIGFKSSMTESQHQSLNGYLNAKVAETHPGNPQTKERVQIDYKHRREVDKFYELPASMHSALPAALREMLNPRHTIKVRVTHDQKTNQVLAKIVKARISDIDIYNPQAPLDCRISINFEWKYDGDIEEIIAAGITERIPDRIKDRLSYKQSHYQIDLTQVTQITSVNGANRVDKEHELEIELSTAAILDQGTRAKSGAPNEYLALVEGLVDNMRVLSRNVPAMQ